MELVSRSDGEEPFTGRLEPGGHVESVRVSLVAAEAAEALLYTSHHPLEEPLAYM